MIAQLAYDNIQSVCKFPVESPRHVSLEGLAHYLREAARDAHEAKGLLRKLWHALPQRDREWWYAFATGPTDGSKASEKDKETAYKVLIEYPDAVSEFIRARIELREIVMRLTSKDVWEEAASDPAFVEAAKRGTADIRAGRVTKVSWDAL